MAIHLTNTRGLWFWTLTIDGVAYRGTSQGYQSAVEAQRVAREVLSRYRTLMATLVA